MKGYTMKILVIDDQERNLQSARELLPEYGDVTTARTIPDAFALLYEQQFDVVLTDLFMPAAVSEGCIQPVFGKNVPDDEVPAGLVFAIKAANAGARVVICTDSDHHKNYLCAVLDLLAVNEFIDPRKEVRGSYDRIGRVEARNAFVGRTGYHGEGPLVKDWLEVMYYSRLFPEFLDKLKEYWRIKRDGGRK